MATNVTTLVAQNFIPEVWSSEIQRARENNLVLARLVKRFDADVKEYGDVVHVPLLSNYTAVAKTANTELPSSATTETKVDITIDKHYGIRIPVEDITAAQSKYALMTEYTKKIGYGLAKQVDSDLASLYSGLSQTLGATASSGAGISETLIVGALRMLDAADAPQEDRAIVVDAYGIEDLRLIDKFTRYDATGQAGSRNEVIAGVLTKRQGTFYGVPVYVSNNISTSSVVGGTLVRGLVMHKEGFALAMQRESRIETWRNGPQLADELIGQVLYGVAEYRDDHAVVLTYPKA